MSDSFRVCPLCEATCGVRVTIEHDAVVRVRGDEADVFSAGYICPKGVALGELHHDPARLRTPLVRDAVTGELRAGSWEEAYGVIRERLGAVVREHGRDAVAVYLGNLNVHNVSSTYFLPAFIRALGTVNRFSASTVDQMPKQVSAGLMFGTPLSIPVPDIDRTDLFLVIGANPMVSNGSLMTAPDMPGRLRALKKRGGRLIVVDPVRTRTAEIADEHIAIRPGSDALWLASIAETLLESVELDLGAALPHVSETSLDDLRGCLADFTPEAVSAITGIKAETTRRIADELSNAASAAVYGRMGTTTSGLSVGGQLLALGTVASWLLDVVNILIGSLDRPGGVMFPLPPAGGPNTEGESGRGRGVRVPGSRSTRVRGLPSVFGEFPAAALAEEIDTPDPVTGERIRAVFTIAGNPALSTPDSRRLTSALGALDLLVSIDMYLTETSRLAHVVLPAPSPLARSHFDAVFNTLAIRNTARWSAVSLPLDSGEQDEARTLMDLAAIAAGVVNSGAEPTAEQIDDMVAYAQAEQICSDVTSRGHGLEVSEVLGAVSSRRGVERILDLRLRSGPYGEGFGRYPGGLDLGTLERAPHGIDIGPLTPRLPEVLRTPSGQIEIAPPQLIAECSALVELLAQPEDGSRAAELVLVGRRQLRSNNSWLHNLPALQGGSNVCSLMMHPIDAAEAHVDDGSLVEVTTDTGSLQVRLAVTEAVRPGVVCMPHGWGHDDLATWGPVAWANPGSNVNALVSSGPIDPLSATSILGGFTVKIRRVQEG